MKTLDKIADGIHDILTFISMIPFFIILVIVGIIYFILFITIGATDKIIILYKKGKKYVKNKRIT